MRYFLYFMMNICCAHRITFSHLRIIEAEKLWNRIFVGLDESHFKMCRCVRYSARAASNCYVFFEELTRYSMVHSTAEKVSWCTLHIQKIMQQRVFALLARWRYDKLFFLLAHVRILCIVKLFAASKISARRTYAFIHVWLTRFSRKNVKRLY